MFRGGRGAVSALVVALAKRAIRAWLMTRGLEQLCDAVGQVIFQIIIEIIISMKVLATPPMHAVGAYRRYRPLNCSTRPHGDEE